MAIFFLILMGILLAGIAFAGVWISKQAKNKQHQQTLLKAKIRAYKNLTSEVEELIQTLKVFDCNADLLVVITQYLIYESEQRLRLDNENAESKSELARYQEQLKQFNEFKAEKEVPSNDRQVALIKRHSAKTIKLLGKLNALNILSELEAQNHGVRLRVLALRSEVDAFLNQGKKSEANDDKVTAASYYKHAKEVLVGSKITFDGKTQEIKAISKKISGLFSSEEPEEPGPQESHPLTTIKDD